MGGEEILFFDKSIQSPIGFSTSTKQPPTHVELFLPPPCPSTRGMNFMSPMPLGLNYLSHFARGRLWLVVHACNPSHLRLVLLVALFSETPPKVVAFLCSNTTTPPIAMPSNAGPLVNPHSTLHISLSATPQHAPTMGFIVPAMSTIRYRSFYVCLRCRGGIMADVSKVECSFQSLVYDGLTERMLRLYHKSSYLL
ncbi:hypothetical protein Hypma_010176 [Hypsizygus marmoreus]|uniref:Uncharacterized protein n=1 Tax=Hypsizygus marmoreus TaxID=39966 RepID=A0A369JS40_HYPMA|nr:hypothetical protein Hypma_010176 [Hypsizygus marmoreus]